MADYVAVVSGMPRSGTSLMMQMLAAGGIPALSDGRRTADEHNPRGYFEDERVRRLARDSSWLDEACGKCVKIIYRLLRHLPEDLAYRVLFMERNAGEVYDSQQGMLRSANDAAAGQEREKMMRALSLELDATREWLAQQPNIGCLVIPYAGLIADAKPWVHAIAEFLDRQLDQAAMAAVVDPMLYRHRRLR